MMQSISLRDHVTERAVIGLYDLIVERERDVLLPDTELAKDIIQYLL